MKITHFAASLDRRVSITSSYEGRWIAYIDTVGHTIGWVTYDATGNSPQEALEALVAGLNCKRLVVDGNSVARREIGPMKLEV